jgi:catechol 2,3-dioxygenase-like lactoylglutathione lyase family enzyme
MADTVGNIVGGVQLARPFRIRRLGHFGVNVADPAVSADFYCRLLGFEVSDELDFGPRLPEAERAKHGPSVGYFTRHGTDHHSFVFFPRRMMQALNPHYAAWPELTVNQITWQVGTLQEVVDGHRWFQDNGRKILRAGRDLPGSNWHFYPPDPSGHINELYYGIEQIGWSGHSKPGPMHRIRYMQPPGLPHRSEFAEVNEAIAQGDDLVAGWRRREPWPETCDVGGVLLARPFKIARVGPVRLFVDELDAALAFYRDALGLSVTEETVHAGHRCVFLRANTEHHSIALYPKALRGALGLPAGSTLLSFAVQLGSYRQLRDAIAFLGAAGVRFRQLPAALSPGMGHHVYAIDPDGNGIQLYWEMEQIGWDGRPRPASARAVFEQDPQRWPETLPAQSDSFLGEVFLGPLN